MGGRNQVRSTRNACVNCTGCRPLSWGLWSRLSFHPSICWKLINLVSPYFNPMQHAQTAQSASSDDLFSPYDGTWELSTFFQQSASGQSHILALLSEAVKQGI